MGGPHGGHLRLYTGEAQSGYVDIPPDGGQLLIFLSARFSYEVLPTRRLRASITGWFRKRPLSAG
jgi:SM-20-related protein